MEPRHPEREAGSLGQTVLQTLLLFAYDEPLPATRISPVFEPSFRHDPNGIKLLPQGEALACDRDRPAALDNHRHHS